MTLRMNHYKWLDQHGKEFFQKVGVESWEWGGMLAAHGDKAYGYRQRWEDAGIHFYHGVAIFLLTYTAKYSKEVQETENGWVHPYNWVITNKDKFLPFLPKVEED